MAMVPLFFTTGASGPRLLWIPWHLDQVEDDMEVPDWRPKRSHGSLAAVGGSAQKLSVFSLSKAPPTYLLSLAPPYEGNLHKKLGVCSKGILASSWIVCLLAGRLHLGVRDELKGKQRPSPASGAQFLKKSEPRDLPINVHHSSLDPTRVPPRTTQSCRILFGGWRGEPHRTTIKGCLPFEG